MPGRRSRPPLARQYARSLAALFLALEIVTASAALAFIFLPMAERSADDLAGLMVLSVRTWAELPPETRPVFEDELARSYQIALRPGMLPPADTGLRHGFYLWFLERAFARRVGQEAFFMDEIAPDGKLWLWTSIPAGGQWIGAGFASSRMQTSPFVALAVALAIGTLLVGVLAWWLARRIAEPVARLEHAAAQLARGARPDLLPETGPREFAELSHHFNQMALQVRELLAARTTLFAGISHDLRTPLARMRIAIEMLTLKPNPALLQRLEHDIDEMNALIAQLLELARGLSTEPPRDFALCDWLQTRARVHESAAEAAGAKIVVDCAAEVTVHAAPGMLARVLDNLIGNALRYAPGPVDLVAEVVAPRAGDAHATVRVGVLDRGPGIPEQQLAAVFQPFHRLEASRSPETGGFGLGLSIVRQLARANGWVVSLASRPGGGLAAWLELPAAP